MSDSDENTPLSADPWRQLKAFTSVPVLATVPAIADGRGRLVWRAAFVSASILIVVGLSAAAAAMLARGNEDLVRLLVRS